MDRGIALLRLARSARPIFQLALLAAGLLALGLGVGAPECLPDVFPGC